jgi:transcription initiation factor TFIIE subunit beta
MDPTTPYSQPANTGFGVSLPTQLFYTEEYLKEKDQPLSFKDIWSYLSIPLDSDTTEADLRHHLQSGRVKVIYDPKGFGGRGNYRYKSKHNVRSGEQLKGYLQRQKTMQGIDVKELRDGWKGSLPAIDELERNHEILVTRNKKNLDAKSVWADDPSLRQDIEPEFKTLWQQVPIPPTPEELRTKLLQAGLKPSTEKKIISTIITKQKKKKGPRKGGRQTNTHMQGLLKDYSHLRR